MKKVFTDISTIAHLWANQIQDEARTPSGTFFFDGLKIYSYGYHFPIAHHVENSKGVKAVLFTTRTYSKTTAKQVSVVRDGSRHLNRIYCNNVSGISHGENFDVWIKKISDIAENLTNARKPEKYLSQMQAEQNEAKIYANYFGLKIPKQLQSLASITDKETLLKFEKNKAKLLLIERRKNIKEAKARIAKSLKEWRAFDSHRMYGSIVDYLRINVDKNRIETSQAVQIPMDLAKKFYINILPYLNGTELFDANKFPDFMQFEVKSIDKYFLSIGCHCIETTEIKAIAKQLKW